MVSAAIVAVDLISKLQKACDLLEKLQKHLQKA
jgi:hypothetical protein